MLVLDAGNVGVSKQALVTLTRLEMTSVTLILNKPCAQQFG